MGLIRKASEADAEIVAFPEVCIPGYHPDALKSCDDAQIRQAEAQICTCCGTLGIAAILGTRYVDPAGRGFNSATIITKKVRLSRD